MADLAPYQWRLLDSTSFQIDDMSQNKASVFITLMPDCPMCANYAKTVNELAFTHDSVAIYGLFPTRYYTDNEVRVYRDKYQLKVPFIMDPDNRLATFLAASVTPEAFVLDRSGKLAYQGAIDDWAIALGKKKRMAQQHYLDDALSALAKGERPVTSYVPAVGCIIEYETE